jgi:predicted RNase H-like HicB family nuclease
MPMAGGFSDIIERDEARYHMASVPELHGCHTQAKSLDKLMERVYVGIMNLISGVVIFIGVIISLFLILQT